MTFVWAEKIFEAPVGKLGYHLRHVIYGECSFICVRRILLHSLRKIYNGGPECLICRQVIVLNLETVKGIKCSDKR